MWRLLSASLLASSNAMTTCSWRSHLDSGVNHHEATAKMVTAPKITGACKEFEGMSDQNSAPMTMTHKIEGLCRHWEEEWGDIHLVNVSSGSCIESKGRTYRKYQRLEDRGNEVHRRSKLSQVIVAAFERLGSQSEA